MINGYPRLHEDEEEEEDFIDVTYVHRYKNVPAGPTLPTNYGQPPNSYKQSTTLSRQKPTIYAPSPTTNYRQSQKSYRQSTPTFQKSPTSTRQQPTTTRELPTSSREFPTISRELPTITDEDLLKLSTRDLNFALKGCSKESMVTLRRRRRLLKNRTYAQRFRDKRVTAEHKYAEENTILKKQTAEHKYAEENTILKKQIADNLKERDLFKKKYFALLEAFRHADTTLCTNVQV